MKKKVLSITVLLLSLFIGINGVDAARVNKKNGTRVYPVNLQKMGLSIVAQEGKNKGETLDYYYYDFKVDYNGNRYDGYCIDYDRYASKTISTYSCNPENTAFGKAAAYLYQNFTGNNYVNSLAMHMLAARMGAIKTNGWQYARNSGLINWTANKDTKTNKWPAEVLPYGNTDLLEQAYVLYKQAFDNYSKDSIKNSLTFTKVSTEGDTVTYNVTAKQKIKKNQIDFTCEGCDIVSTEWNEISGKLVVKDTKDDCTYTINAYYPASGTFICDPGGDEYQQIVIFVSETEEQQVDTSGEPTQYFSDYIDTGDYFTTVCGGKNNKCTDQVPEVQAQVYSCCEDNPTSTIVEPSLNDLFCNDTELKVDHYVPKPGAQQYLEYDHDMDTDYCKMYCTERIKVDIPGAMTATNGKYFQLSQIDLGGGNYTYAPHVESVKRCRIRIEYDKWIKDYQEQVDIAIENYNSYQENSAYYELYKDAKKESQSASNVNVYCSVTPGYSYEKGTDGNMTSVSSKAASGKYSLANISSVSYNKYTFNVNGDRYYFRSVKIDEDLREKYTSEKILDGGQKYEATTTPNPKYWGGSLESTIDAINNALNTNGNVVSDSCQTLNGVTACGHYSCTASAGANQLLSLVGKIEDVETVRDTYNEKRNNAKNNYNGAVAQIKNLQETLTHCDNYFNEVEPTDIYDVPTSMSNFKYTQIYQDDYGNPTQTQVTVGFAGSCTITRKDGAPDTFATTGGSINYSTDPYGRVYEIMKVFGDDISYDKKASGEADFYKKFIAEDYEADKMFWHDGAYQAICDWNRTDVDKYTVDNGDVIEWKPSDGNNYRLVPRGEVYNYNQSTTNYTDHEFVFSYSTSYDGHFETYWNLHGLGEDGKFDKYFEEDANNHTCSSQSPSDSELLTCRLHAFHGGSFYGCCCGDDGYTTRSDEKCSSYGDKALLYDFKIIDTSNVFPAETKNYANNWKTKTGQEAKEAIEALGKELNTYSPSTLTYSFKLTPSDMKQIKEYNTLLNNYGGYTDYNLSCDCSAAQGEGNQDNNKSCVQCKSSFLTNLAEGKIINGKTLTGGWNRKDKTLTEVRNSGNVKWAVNK